jgi:hypothetical protein
MSKRHLDSTLDYTILLLQDLIQRINAAIQPEQVADNG